MTFAIILINLSETSTMSRCVYKDYVPDRGSEREMETMLGVGSDE